MTKTVTRFFTIADFIEEEKWLREMHNQGWKLSKMTPPCFFTFESCEPEDVIYRLDFRDIEDGYLVSAGIISGKLRIPMLPKRTKISSPTTHPVRKWSRK